MIAPEMGEGFKVKLRGFNSQKLNAFCVHLWSQTFPRDSIVVFGKLAAIGLQPRHIEPLRKRGILVGLDFLDFPLGKIDPHLFDFYISSSLSGIAPCKAYLESQGRRDPVVEYLPHHHDQRLSSLHIPKRTTFSCCYFGSPKEVHVPESLADSISMMDVLNTKDFEDTLPKLGDFAMHYSIRPPAASPEPERQIYKPFTKGITAAACRANIVAPRGFDDAEELLGPDYPFLVDPTSDASVIAGFEFAKDAFGGPQWAEGLDMMEALKASVSPGALAQRFRDIIAHVRG